MLPSRIKNIESILSKFVSKSEETELRLAERITETAHLQNENIRLRQRLNTKEKENRSLEQDLLGETMKTNTEEFGEQNHGTLLTGSSIIRDINQKDFDIDTGRAYLYTWRPCFRYHSRSTKQARQRKV